MRGRSSSDREYIEGIIKGNSKIVRSFYSRNKPIIVSYVLQRGGMYHDVEDVMQQAMMVFYEKVSLKGFSQMSTIDNFYLGICKNVWLQQLASRDRSCLKDIDVSSLQLMGESEIDEDLYARRLRLYYQCFRKLSQQCQNIIKMRQERIPYVAIVKELNLGNANNASSKKNYCQKKLENLIKTHNSYRDLKDEE